MNVRLWNLSKFSELEPVVVETFRSLPARRTDRSHKHQNRPARFKVAVGIAALTATFSMGVAQSNASMIRLPLASVAVARSIADPRPPLEGLFRNRFGDTWTEEVENELLMRLETNRLQGSSRSQVEQTIDVVFSNLSEDLTDTNRGSKDQVSELVKPRKLRR
jgi:hypothetical protein